MPSHVIEAYKRRRDFERRLGILGFWGGLLCLLLDMATPFPTPVRGAMTLWWLLIIGAGVIFWILSKRYPEKEILELAKQHNGELTVPDVTGALGVDAEFARQILGRMQYLREAVHAESEGGGESWFFLNTSNRTRDKGRIIGLARQHGGTLLVDQVTRETGLDWELAEELLAELEADRYFHRHTADDRPDEWILRGR